MTEMKVEIPTEMLDAALQVKLQEAIVVALGEKGREKIIAEAVTYLTKPLKDYRYDQPVSPLMAMVFDGAREVAKAYIEKQFATDTALAKQVEDIYAEAMKKMFGVENREKLVDLLVKNFGKALGERY